MLLNQLQKMLPKHDQVAYELKNDEINVMVDGKLKLYIRANGGITCPENMEYDEMYYKLHDEIVQTREMVNEYLTAMNDAPDLKAIDFNMPYKKLAEFNGTVLGGVITQNGEYNFTTWKYENNSLFWGHYHGKNYEAAKEDFAARANFVNENKIFHAEELTEISRCISDTLEGGYELTDKARTILENIQTKVQSAVSNFDELFKQTIDEEIQQGM